MNADLVNLFSSEKDYRIFISYLWDITTDIIDRTRTGSYVTKEGLHSYINREDDYEENAEGVRMYGRDSALNKRARDNTNFVEVDEIDGKGRCAMTIGRRIHDANYRSSDKHSRIMDTASYNLASLFAENSIKSLEEEIMRRLRENSIEIEAIDEKIYQVLFKKVTMRIDTASIIQKKGLVGFSLRFILFLELVDLSSLEPKGEEYEKARIRFQSRQ